MSFAFKASLVIAQAVDPPCFLISMTLLARVVSPKTRGTFFAFNGLFGSAMIVLIQKLGEETFSGDNAIVFWGSSGFNLVALVSLIICAAMGKLHN